MKLSRLSFLMTVWVGLTACMGSTLYQDNEISKDDVLKSVKFLWTAQYDKPNEIKEKWPQYYKKAIKGLDNQMSPLGLIFSDTAAIHVAFRGTLGMELLSSVSKDTTPLSGLFQTKLPGVVHKGYATVYSEFRAQLMSEIETYKKTHAGSTPITLSGYSRGAAFATLAALDFGLTFKEGVRLTVLTYGAANIFDAKGGDFYLHMPGKYHLNFLCKEDGIAPYANIHTLGSDKDILFSANDLEDYKKRVANKAYTDMDKNLAGLLRIVGVQNLSNMAGMLPQLSLFPNLTDPHLVQMLESSCWEAHALKTYYDMAPMAMSKS